ncbi:MAG: glycosyltransferase family 39 protein [Flavobacteriales bacterium]|nr:glycosyltransferase family 39 protein [Flavobacteriales bacterium]
MLLENATEKIQKSRYYGLIVILLYALLAFAMRFFSFSRSLIDWDESTYILIVDALLSGKRLYVDVIDPKPPGIFLIFGALQYLFDNAIVAVRVAGTFFVIGTAYFLFRIGNLFKPKNALIGILSGIFYISLISFNSPSNAIARGYGLEANTELFFIFFTVASVFFLLKKGNINLVISGLLIGFSFIIKYLVFFEILGFCFYLLLRKKGTLGLRETFIYGFASTVPFALVNLYFYFFSDYDAFYYITFEVGGRYSSTFDLLKTAGFLGNLVYLTGFIGVNALIVLIFARPSRFSNKEKTGFILCLIWFVSCLAGAVFTRKYFTHYLYVCFPAMALISAFIVHPVVVISSKWKTRIKHILVVTIALFIPSLGYLKYKTLFSKPDIPKEIAEIVNRDEDRSLFVMKGPHIVYHLVEELPPTKYYHPSLIYKADHISALEIDITKEYKKVFQSKPKYLLIEGTNSEFRKYKSQYEVLKEFGPLKLFERKTDF